MRLRSLWPARLLVLGLGALVVVLVGAVVAQGASSASRAAALRHQLVAERLFDGMERELTDFLDDEEMRPFIEYRPVDGLVEQRADFVVGYFQIDPEGTPSNPHPLEADEADRVEAASAALEGWGSEPVAPRTTTMNVQVKVPPPPPRRGTRSSSGSAPSTKAAPAKKGLPEQAVTLPPETQLNNAWAPRQSRGSQVQKVSPSLLSTYEEPVQQQQPAPAAEAVKQTMWVPVEVPVPDAPAEVVDVVVSPFTLDYPDAKTLRMHRTVRIGPRTWVQGLVVDVPALQAHLAQTALVGTELGAYIDVRWQKERARTRGSYSRSKLTAARDYAFDYTFGPPFERFEATAHLDTLPGDANTAIEGLVQLLAVLLLGAAMLGLLAVYRMIAVTLVYAQQRADFVSAVTHELKSPLTSIRMYSEMLETGMVPGPERQREYYTTIRLESERLGRLVDDVLAFSRVDRGLTVASGDTGRVREVIDDVVRLLEPVAEAAGARLEVTIDEGVGDVTIDRDALAHVLTNLVDNAVKFSADASDRTVQLHALREGERVVVVVRDHGPGVPRQLLNRIFEPFFRGERELTRKTKGTGIGLALVRSMVERLEGAIDARNHPEGGFEVRVALPV